MVDLLTSLTHEFTDVRSAAGLGLPLDGPFPGELNKMKRARRNRRS